MATWTGKLAVYIGPKDDDGKRRKRRHYPICLVIGREITGARMDVGTIYSGWLVLLGDEIKRVSSMHLKELT